MKKSERAPAGERRMQDRLKDWAINGTLALAIGGGLYFFVRGF